MESVVVYYNKHSKKQKPICYFNRVRTSLVSNNIKDATIVDIENSDHDTIYYLDELIKYDLNAIFSNHKIYDYDNEQTIKRINRCKFIRDIYFKGLTSKDIAFKKVPIRLLKIKNIKNGK